MTPIDLLKADPMPPWKPGPHTPGPWSEFAESGDYWIAQVVEDGMPGAVVCDSVGITEGDTNLICAAPELLAACERIIQEAERDCIDDSEWSDGERMARSAIAKARGGLPQ